MQMVVICEMYGWTYDEYLDQPQWFVGLITEKLKVDYQRQENEAKKSKSR